MNNEENDLIYEDILNGSLQKKILTFRKLKENLKKNKPTPGFS